MNLYPYQETGVEFLLEAPRRYLADRMGLGKTVQALVALQRLGPIDPPLVIAPAGAIPTWREQSRKFGVPAPPMISYTGFIHKDWRRFGRPSVVILDEAHYCKTPSAQRTKAALKVAQSADRAWLLSGTPMPNDPRELYTAFKMLWPDLMPEGVRTAADWRDHYTKWRPTTFGPKVYGTRNAADLRRRLDTFMLRRGLRDVGLEIPPVRVDVQFLPYMREFAEELGRIEQTRGLDLSHAETRRLLGVHKAGPVAKTIAAEMRDRAYPAIVVMYYHLDVGGEVGRVLREAGLRVVGFDGSATERERTLAINTFRAEGADVFLVQQGAGGTGVDGLQDRASEIVLLEPHYSPEINAQYIKRVHRIGQDRPVRARLFAVDGSADAGLMDSLAAKVAMHREVFG